MFSHYTKENYEYVKWLDRGNGVEDREMETCFERLNRSLYDAQKLMLAEKLFLVMSGEYYLMVLSRFSNVFWGGQQ